MRPQPQERQVSEQTVREIERTHVQRGAWCAECWVETELAAPPNGVDYPCPPARMAREIRRLWAFEDGAALLAKEAGSGRRTGRG